jgi:hypothetical protein
VFLVSMFFGTHSTPSSAGDDRQGFIAQPDPVVVAPNIIRVKSRPPDDGIV